MTLGLWLRDILEESMRGIAAESALAVAERARASAPNKSGVLMNSIAAEEGVVVCVAPYAAAVEFRQPFLRPALLEEREALKTRIAEFIAGARP